MRKFTYRYCREEVEDTDYYYECFYKIDERNRELVEVLMLLQPPGQKSETVDRIETARITAQKKVSYPELWQHQIISARDFKNAFSTALNFLKKQ